MRNLLTVISSEPVFKLIISYRFSSSGELNSHLYSAISGKVANHARFYGAKSVQQYENTKPQAKLLFLKLS